MWAVRIYYCNPHFFPDNFNVAQQFVEIPLFSVLIGFSPTFFHILTQVFHLDLISNVHH